VASWAPNPLGRHAAVLVLLSYIVGGLSPGATFHDSYRTPREPATRFRRVAAQVAAAAASKSILRSALRFVQIFILTMVFDVGSLVAFNGARDLTV
jgi:hypothetical protein